MTTNMYNSTSENYATICRLCLGCDGYMLAIFNTEEIMPNNEYTMLNGIKKHNEEYKFYIFQKISEFLQVQVSFDDGLPPNICHRCLYKIELCTDFRKTCLQSDATLRHNLPVSIKFPTFKQHTLDKDNKINRSRVVSHLQFEEFSLQNHKFIENSENVENVVTVVDPTVECDDSDNENEVETEENRLDETECNEPTMANEPHSEPEPENDTNIEVSDLKNVFMCQYCDRAFIDQECCYLHEQSNHDTDTPFVCQECDMAFADRVNYTAHLKSVHKNDKPFGCPQCDRAFGRRSDLRKHTIVHTGIKPFTCQICFKSFSRNTNLNKHLRIHSGHKPHVCPKCPRTFISKGDLSRHMLIHSGIKPFSCSHCDQSFGRRDKLLRHEKRHLKNAENKSEMPSVANLGFLNDQLVIERQMNDFNTTESEIKQEVDSDQWDSENMVISLDPYSHNEQMESISPERGLYPRIPDHIEHDTSKLAEALTESHETNRLEQSPSTSSKLPEHITGDDGFPGFSAEDVKIAKSALLKQYSCSLCLKRFSSDGSLKCHMGTHTTLRPYACTLCPKSFLRKRELDRHMTTHTGMKPFGCKVCDKKFGRKDKLGRHMRIHDTSRYYSCTYCTAKFYRENGLLHHLKMHMIQDNLTVSTDGESLMLNSQTNSNQYTNSNNETQNIL